MSIDRTRNHILFAKVSRLLGVASKTPNEDTVHHLRASIRRVEAVFQTLLAKSRRDFRLSKRLKKIRKRAGRVRDLDVQLNALKTIDIGAKGKHKGRIARSLEKKRQRRAVTLTEMLGEQDLPDLRLQLREKAALLRTAIATRQPKAVRPVDQALRLFVKLAKGMPHLSAGNLHEFRTECKHLRYIAEIEGNDPATQGIVEALEPLQDAIGEWHDWALLTETSEELLSSHVNSPLLSAIRNLTVSKLATALRVAKEAKSKMLQLAETQAELENRSVPSPRQAKRPERGHRARAQTAE